jgi:hypothetical protein
MKYKFKRRRAIECKFIEKSKTSPGYLKYEVTICEKDGTIHTEPAYGVDMQSAIARLVNQERTVKVEKQITKYPFIAFAAWILLMSWPLLVGITYNTPQMLLYSFGGIIILTIIGGLWSNYINKK